MTVIFDRSVASVTAMAGILFATAAGLTLLQSLAEGRGPVVYALESGSRRGLETVAGTPVTAETERDNHRSTDAQSKEAYISPLITRGVVLGHYPGYAAHRLPVNRVRYDVLTHVAYFSVWPLADGDLNVSEVNVTDLEELVTRADANDVTTLVTVGGWGRSTYFAAMAASPSARANFAANLLQYCLDYSLKGADLDWEPVSTVTDRTNYSLLVEEVHEAFEPFSLSLSVSVSAYGHEITAEAIEFVDSVNVMAYDGTPPHHSKFDFAVSALDHWEGYGAPRGKLMLGVPFYGKSEDGTGHAYHDIFDAYHPGPDMDFVGGIGFNGITTVKNKTTYAVRNGYRGVMIWEISQDTMDGSSLLTAVGDAITSCLHVNRDGNGGVDLYDL